MGLFSRDPSQLPLYIARRNFVSLVNSFLTIPYRSADRSSLGQLAIATPSAKTTLTIDVTLARPIDKPIGMTTAMPFMAFAIYAGHLPMRH